MSSVLFLCLQFDAIHISRHFIRLFHWLHDCRVFQESPYFRFHKNVRGKFIKNATWCLVSEKWKTGNTFWGKATVYFSLTILNENKSQWNALWRRTQKRFFNHLKDYEKMDYCVNIPREEREFHNLKTSNKFSFNSAKTRKNQ
jgi:hypothetical protein